MYIELAQKLINVIYQINRLKKMNHIISIDVGKAFGKIHPLMTKILSKQGIEGEHPQLDKVYLKTLQLTSYVMGEKQDAFPFCQKQGKEIHSPHSLKKYIVLEMLASEIKQKKKK